MAELSKGKETVFNRDELIYHGYDWQFFTEEMVLTNHTQRFCYDFGVEFDVENQVRIITKQYNKKTRKAKLMPMAAEG
ncbi:MAG: hypothetical protein IPK10_02205 [Bacteroidetes bacterium]|nr:hypothetical protein [Bacteroidota bacterium]